MLYYAETMKKIVEYLEALGFSSTEAKLYITLLESGPLTNQELAKAAKINRTATYTYISSLLEKGVLLEVRTNTRKRFDAVKPEQLHFLIDNKLDKVRATDNQFPAFVQTINASFAKGQVNEKASIK